MMRSGVRYSQGERGEVEDEPAHHLERGTVSRPVIFKLRDNRFAGKAHAAGDGFAKHPLGDVIEDAAKLIEQLFVMRRQLSELRVQRFLVALEGFQFLI